MIIKRTKTFLKSFKKCPRKIQEKVILRIDLFADDPTHPILNVHKLHGELDGIYSLNVTGDYRIWFIKEDNEICIITLLNIGRHSQLY
jgi:addiction module RelE/StbE family toxin